MNKKYGLIFLILMVLLVLNACTNDKAQNNAIQNGSNGNQDTSSNNTYRSHDGWSFEYPKSWDKATDSYVQDTATGKTIVFEEAEVSSQQELEDWIQSEIDRKMSSEEEKRKLVEPLTKNDKNGLTVYRYAIYLEAGDVKARTLPNVIFFDGNKRYAFRTEIPDVTEDEFNLVIDTFKVK